MEVRINMLAYKVEEINKKIQYFLMVLCSFNGCRLSSRRSVYHIASNTCACVESFPTFFKLVDAVEDRKL